MAFDTKDGGDYVKGDESLEQHESNDCQDDSPTPSPLPSDRNTGWAERVGETEV
ncbi:Hypothetical protein SMAX5B_014288 [Scophthalmus maximus]|uniref:Uncharacterized protein n=1 Tax=Scophthalmus maximus TaxID=52904 RepID=A0A2U9BGI3_SCOMX|nr:Hypothetical protein SMAX5B_014288 [Scophthalmus maximus]